MSRRKISGLRGLITGASSGIGQELAIQLADQGARLLLTARRDTLLNELVARIQDAGGEAFSLAGDITDSEHRKRLIAAAQNDLGGLDLLINNAGVGAIGPFAEADPQRLRQVMEVDFFAPVELIRSSLPVLRAGRTPMIVNIGSVLGHRAVPGKSEYCAAKFAIHGFSDALRAELASSRVDVLLVSPSTTKTAFFDNVLEKNSDRAEEAFGASTPASLARSAIRAIRRGRHEIIHSAGGKLLVWFDRLLPGLADRILAR